MIFFFDTDIFFDLGLQHETREVSHSGTWIFFLMHIFFLDACWIFLLMHFYSFFDTCLERDPHELPDKTATNRWLTGKDSSLLRSHCIYDRDESPCKS